MLEAIVEQLRSPLMQIHLLSQDESSSGDIHSLTTGLIELLDNMHIATFLNDRQLELQLEPINLVALAEDTAQKYLRVARMHDIDLQVLATRRHPVLANRDFLCRAYESMTNSMIELSKNNESSIVRLRTDDTDGDTRFGVYASSIDFSADDLRKLKRLFGHTARPLPRVSTTPAAQLYVADRLLESMGARLRTSIANKERGLATVLPISRQLSLVSL